MDSQTPQQPVTQPQQPMNQPQQQPVQVGGQKQLVTAELLAAFLGAFGIHDFYLGRKVRGSIRLIIGAIGLLLAIQDYRNTGIVFLAMVLWAIDDFNRIYTKRVDAKGVALAADASQLKTAKALRYTVFTALILFVIFVILKLF